MYLICIDNNYSSSDFLTIGKKYEILTIDGGFDPGTKYFIGDDNKKYLFEGSKGDFTTLSKWRLILLNKILKSK
jgi:hypothetical protein